MGRRYQQFSLEERCEIASRRVGGESIRQIAAALDRAPSSVSRELTRNASSSAAYKPAYAGQQAKARRWRGSRLLRDPDLQAQVLDRLARGWSPQQVAGRLAREHGQTVISHESIYRFIAAQIARTKNYAWRHYLPRAKSKRGWRGRKGGSSALHIKDRTPIHQRPAVAADRLDPGHWEADLMLFAAYGQAVLTVHERSSRLLVIVRQPDKTAAHVAASLEAMLVALPSNLRQTITFDNGTEFALHHVLRDKRRNPDLLLRYSRSLAKRRHRECHRQAQAFPPTQDQPRHPGTRRDPRPRRPLQSHPTKMPRLPDPG